jgi:hypothetical protein
MQDPSNRICGILVVMASRCSLTNDRHEMKTTLHTTDEHSIAQKITLEMSTHNSTWFAIARMCGSKPACGAFALHTNQWPLPMYDPWVTRSSIIRHTGLYNYGLCNPSHTDATSLPLLHRDVPARTPLALLAQELRRQPMSTGPSDHFNPLHFDTTLYPFALPAEVLHLAKIEPTTSGTPRNGCAGVATNVRSMV